jgi:hypothetical protein
MALSEAKVSCSGVGTVAVNCRDLTDAFPWVPNDLREHGEQQVMHFFHLVWIAEICKTLAIVDQDESGDYRWLENWLEKLYGTAFTKAATGEKIVAHARSFVESEKEHCRLEQLGRSQGLWALARIDLLDSLFAAMAQHVSWMGKLPVYMFLDDYTVPIVPRAIQLTLI